MKNLFLFFLFLLISCQKHTPEKRQSFANSGNKKEIIAPKEIILKTDTISILENGEYSKNSFILAHLLELKTNKDSVVSTKYRLDFYSNKTKTVSSNIAIKNYEKGSEWSAFYGLTSTDFKNSPFIQVNFGYPACGYLHNNYLYYLKDNTIELVDQWQTVTDSGWGSWMEFVNPSGKAKPESFYAKIVSFEPTDDNEDFGILTYSDSTVFRLKGTHWQKQLLSEKEKPYFEKKVSFNDFHNQK